ncbi:MAG: hypothetical protein ACKOTZ_14085 [Chloroflexota bacterium]
MTTAERTGGGRTVAILLALAAILAAAVSARAGLYASDATSAWTAAVGTEQKRGALRLADVRDVYGAQADQALMVASARLRADRLRAAMTDAAPEVVVALEVEARVHDQVATIGASGQSPLRILADPVYLLPSGAYDLPRVLADARAALGAEIAADPAAALADGDRAAARSQLLLALTIPIACVFLAGALAQAWRRFRRPLLATGWVVLGAAGVSAVVVGLLA